MNYRSLADLARCVRNNLQSIPRDVDLIVGIPRSGMLAGSIVSLLLNIPIVDLNSFIENRPIQGGARARYARGKISYPQEASNPLFFDDSIGSGAALAQVKAVLAQHFPEKLFRFAVIYATPEKARDVDIFFEKIPVPRIFEWNVMHHSILERSCVDIDGILCSDPTSHQNDDGVRYQHFLDTAAPLVIPTREIGNLVTSRLEKYRDATVRWMDAHQVVFHQLHMLDLPSASERRRLGVHGSFKAGVYKSIADAPLFIESERDQASEIARLSGKPVLCPTTQELFTPNVSLVHAQAKVTAFRIRLTRRFKRLLP